MAESKEVDFRGLLDSVWKFGRFWVWAAGICFLFLVPLIFALFDDDQLAMSDDYAAVTSAATAT